MRCEELNILFIDICKTAGHSIRQAFRRKYRAPGNHHSVRNFTAEGCKPKDPKKIYDSTKWNATCDIVTEEDLNTYRTFSVIRNPYDRLVSLYLWGPKYRKVSFEIFMSNIKNNVYNSLNQHHFKSQLEWISDYNDNIKIQKLLRFENLDEDFYNLLEEWNVPQFKLEKLNTAEERIARNPEFYAAVTYGKKRHNYRYYYNSESRKIAEELYAKDIEYFNYEY